MAALSPMDTYRVAGFPQRLTPGPWLRKVAETVQSPVLRAFTTSVNCASTLAFRLPAQVVSPDTTWNPSFGIINSTVPVATSCRGTTVKVSVTSWPRFGGSEKLRSTSTNAEGGGGPLPSPSAGGVPETGGGLGPGAAAGWPLVHAATASATVKTSARSDVPLDVCN